MFTQWRQLKDSTDAALAVAYASRHQQESIDTFFFQKILYIDKICSPNAHVREQIYNDNYQKSAKNPNHVPTAAKPENALDTEPSTSAERRGNRRSK